KAIEAYYTIWMELLLSKQRIFELYINHIEFAEGVYGVSAGSLHHFDIPPSELGARDISQLLAIMPSPRRWSITNLPERAEFRRRQIEREVQRNMEIQQRAKSLPSCLK
ncbi:MAG: transglycosylase domain-containing protein, partial [Limisphaerales bacterium]